MAPQLEEELEAERQGFHSPRRSHGPCHRPLRIHGLCHVVVSDRADLCDHPSLPDFSPDLSHGEPALLAPAGAFLPDSQADTCQHSALFCQIPLAGAGGGGRGPLLYSYHGAFLRR